ncbi:MAG TPA: hypothetical protein VFS24_05995 [Steroidobacteraceae bacterium]|nr:hypothetical protein [Steroidobacteraceae bacterium]
MVLRVVVAAIVGTFIWLTFRRAGWLRGPASLCSIIWDADGRWFLSRSGQRWEASLRGDSYVSSRALLLRWDAVDANLPRNSMLLTRADLGLVDFRRLVVRLRIDGARARSATDSLLARDAL